MAFHPDSRIDCRAKPRTRTRLATGPAKRAPGQLRARLRGRRLRSQRRPGLLRAAAVAHLVPLCPAVRRRFAVYRDHAQCRGAITQTSGRARSRVYGQQTPGFAARRVAVPRPPDSPEGRTGIQKTAARFQAGSDRIAPTIPSGPLGRRLNCRAFVVILCVSAVRYARADIFTIQTEVCLGMKRVLSVLLVFVFALSALSVVAQEATPEATETPEAFSSIPPALAELAASGEWELPDLGGREVTIAVENAYLPFNFIDQVTGDLAVWEYDVLNYLGMRLNFVPVYIETSWDGMIVAVSQVVFDMVADGMTITEVRDEIVDFSLGYIQLQQRLLARAGEDRFTSAEEFAADESLIMGSQPGTTNYDLSVELVGAERVQRSEERRVG